MRLRTLVGSLVGLAMAGVAAIAMIVAFIVFVVAALAALAAVATAAVAYFKRESWTLPAYRWARDQTGKWSVTPWTGGDATPTGDAPPGEEPAKPGRAPRAA